MGGCMVGTQFLIASSSFVSHCLIRSFGASVSLSARRVYVSAHAHMQLLPVLCEQGNAEGLLTVLTQPVLPVSWHGIQSGLQMALPPPWPPSGTGVGLPFSPEPLSQAGNAGS